MIQRSFPKMPIAHRARLLAILIAATFAATAAGARDWRADVRPLASHTRPVLGDDSLQGSFVLVGGRLFDGTGAAPRPATIVVQGKVITAVLEPGERNWPDDAVVYDVTGKTVMPGLIDLHTHLTYVDNLDLSYIEANASAAESVMRGVRRMALFLKSGVTTVRDVASHGDAPFVLKHLQAKGQIQGPRIFAAGQLITSTGGHAAILADRDNLNAMVRIADGPDAWREAVRAQYAHGADLIKLASEYSQEEINAAVDEAHSLGLPVTIDSETQYIDMAIRAGVDSMEHPLPRSDEAVALMAAHGIASVPTIITYMIAIRSDGGYFGATSRRFELTEKTILEMARKMRLAGVKMGIGTDLILMETDYLPGGYIAELKNFTEIGFSKAEALVAATKTNAEILRVDDQLGTIEVGKRADIIVIDGRPDKNLDALRKVRTVFINGRLMLDDGLILMPAHRGVSLPADR